MLLAPWCVNERTSVFAIFAVAKSAINDHTLSLTKSSSEIMKITTSWKIKETSRIVYQLAVNCCKMWTLLNSARNAHILFQHTNIQPTIPDVSGELQNENIFENSIKLKCNTKLTLEIMNKLTLEMMMQPARDPSNCTGCGMLTSFGWHRP